MSNPPDRANLNPFDVEKVINMLVLVHHLVLTL